MKRISALLIEGLILILFLLSCSSREMKKAKEFMDAGMYEQAISLIEIEIQANPKNAEASFLLGKCFLQTSNFGKVEESFNRAILLNTDFKTDIGNIYFDKSLELYRSDDPQNADSYYKEGIKYNPSGYEEFTDKLFGYAIESSETSTDPTKSIQIFNTINQISPNYKTKIADKTYLLASSFIEKGFVKEGFEYAEFGINFDPAHIKDVAELYYNYANSLLNSLNRPSESISFFERCISLNSSKKIEIGNIIFNQAKVFEKNNDIILLLLFAQKCKEINPEYNSWYLQIAEKYKPKIPINGLIAYYPLNGNAVEENRSGSSGNIHAASFTEDRFNSNMKALYLNGTPDQFVDLGQWNLSRAFSISVFVKYQNFKGTGSVIVSKYSDRPGDYRTFYINILPSKKSAFLLGVDNRGSNSAIYVTSNSTIETDTWCHLAVSYDGSSMLKMYINGKLDLVKSDIQTSTIFNSSIPVYIGRLYSSWDSYDCAFKGSIDDLRFYNRVLTDQEVEALSNE